MKKHFFRFPSYMSRFKNFSPGFKIVRTQDSPANPQTKFIILSFFPSEIYFLLTLKIKIKELGG